MCLHRSESNEPTGLVSHSLVPVLTQTHIRALLTTMLSPVILYTKILLPILATHLIRTSSPINCCSRASRLSWNCITLVLLLYSSLIQPCTSECKLINMYRACCENLPSTSPAWGNPLKPHNPQLIWLWTVENPMHKSKANQYEINK